MAKKALVLLAEGFEEVEAITPVDYLRRAGVEVTVAAITESPTVKGAWTGLKVLADTTLFETKTGEWDAVILPGGMPGASNLAASKEVCSLLKDMAAAKKLICAICASPAVVLAPLGLLNGKDFTCYPGMEKKLSPELMSGFTGDNATRVVVDGNIITSRGAGTAGDFAIAIIEELIDETIARKVMETVQL
jgi:4-methyl-5(b-hydroxyethyl)-thiazole monophosphate biosynthesis